jgi:predicted enzyme related to lactoylglutathione lyase
MIQKLGMVIHPVEDLESAARFYESALGLTLKFRDGDRFCAFDLGGVTIALAAGTERLTQSPAVSLKVADLDAALAKLQAAGAKLLRGPEVGPHERRAVLEDPAGNALILYAPK